MPKKMLIDATHAEETRVVVVDGNKVEEFDFESENKRQLAGNIYLAKVTRVEPSLQAAFVDYGGNRHGFLAFSEIHPDYYQIPVADREALLEEERAYVEAQRRDEDDEESPKRRSRSRRAPKAEKTGTEDAVATREIDGMETIDLDPDAGSEDKSGAPEGSSPMETVAETPVETPAAEEAPEAEDTEVEDVREVASADDDSAEIESVADEDDSEDIRPVRKPRPRKYKIQEVVKVRQILLVQVVKEERGNKGAALTTYLSLAGRYCVLMPNTARGGGISRKITNAPDRKKLKEIAAEIDVPTGAGLIIRTAGAKRTKSEIKRDYEYLQRLWEQIRELTLKSIAPAKIYEEGNLIKRSIRDLYNREIDEVLVEGEAGYRVAKDFMKMIMPSHAKNVKHYQDAMPLFARSQVEGYLAGMFNPTVQLKSGGYIVIGVTEALVAIDVNSGRATKEGSIEETALRTNLEAAEEVARQLRLRDLAGLIVIDFIDMDERKNNAAVEKKMKDKLKTDRARIQVGRISGFGLLEMSRQRLRPGMIEATTQPCSHCHGTGLLRSDDNVALSILRQIEEEGVRGRSREVLVKCPVAVANYLINQKRDHVAQIEVRYSLSVRIEADATMVSPDFTMEKFKTAIRNIAAVAAPVVSVDTSLMDAIDAQAVEEPDEEIEDEVNDVPETVEAEETPSPKKRRRRRRRRKSNGAEGENGTDTDASNEGESTNEAAPAEASETEAETPAEEGEEKPKRKRTRSRSRRKSADAVTPVEGEAAGASEETSAEAQPEAEAAEPEAEEKPKPKRTRSRRKPAAEKTEAPAAEAPTDAVESAPVAATEPAAEQAPEPVAETAAEPERAAEPTPEPEAAQEAKPQPAEQTQEPEPALAEAEPDDSSKPKRRGWWSLGR
ncbi:ribonuclease E/G [Poseidonocella pacifica]|nr:ribonuclease E/G [Poseidonocella pacifica]